MTAPYSPDNPFAPRAEAKGESYSADNPFAPKPGLVTRLARADQQIAEGVVNFVKGTVKGTADMAGQVARIVAPPVLGAPPLMQQAEDRLHRAGDLAKGLVMTPVNQAKTLVTDPNLAHKTEAALGLATLAAPLVAKGVGALRGRAAEAPVEAPAKPVAEAVEVTKEAPELAPIERPIPAAEAAKVEAPTTHSLESVQAAAQRGARDGYTGRKLNDYRPDTPHHAAYEQGFAATHDAARSAHEFAQDLPYGVSTAGNELLVPYDQPLPSMPAGERALRDATAYNMVDRSLDVVRVGREIGNKVAADMPEAIAPREAAKPAPVEAPAAYSPDNPFAGAPKPKGPAQMTRAEFEATGADLKHGTSRSFDTFDAEAPNRYGRAGGNGAFYFTKKPEVANTFAEATGAREVSVPRYEPEFFDLDPAEQAATLTRLRGDIQKQIDAGHVVDMLDPDGRRVSVRSAAEIDDAALHDANVRVWDKGRAPRVIETKVYGPTLDLTDPSRVPPATVDALRQAGAWYPSKERPLDFSHERSAKLVEWARANGYGKIDVPDAFESGFRSTIALPEYIGHGRDAHRAFVEQAIQRGETVPAAVLRDYPDIAAPRPEAPAAPVAETPAAPAPEPVAAPEPAAPTADLEAWADGVKARHGLEQFNVVRTRNLPDMIELQDLAVPREQRSQGVGSEAMRELTDYADAQGLRIKLTPGSRDDLHGTTSRSRLVRFYKRFGFKENKGRSFDPQLGGGVMYREPAAKPPVSDEAGFARIRPPSVTEELPPAIRGAYARAASKIDFTGGIAKQAKRDQAGSLSNRIQRIGDAIANGQEPIVRLGEKVEDVLPPTRNPKYLLNLAKASDHTVARAVREGVPDPLTREVVGPSYESLFQPFGKNDREIQQALTYAVQKRLLNRGVDAFGGDAAAMGDAQTLVQHFDQSPKMRQFADDLGRYTDALGNYAVKSGLWTPDQWEAMKASDALYIPIKRLMEGPSSGYGAPGRLANVTSGVKKFLGSRRAQANPAETLAAYTRSIISRADAYRVGHAIFDAADKMGPDGEMILTRVPAPDLPTKSTAMRNLAERAAASGHPLPPDALKAIDDLHVPSLDPSHPVIWRNGPEGREYAVVNAPDLYQAVAGLNLPPSAVQKFLDLTLLPMKRVFTAATTGFVPRFAGGTNPARDVAEALAKTRNGLTPLDIARGYAEAIGGVAGKSKLAAEAEAFGLGNVSQFGDHQGPATIAHRFAPTTMGQRLAGEARAVTIGDKSILAGAERIGDASDKGPRLAEYVAATRKAQSKLASGEWTPEDVSLYAADAGRRITLDFANRPGNPVVRAVSRYIPFFNPALQSPVSFVRAAARNPGRMTAYASSVAAAAVGAWVLKHRSQETLASINDRPAEERGGFLLFPMDDKAHFTMRLPLGQETALVAAGVTAGLDAWFDKDPHAARQFVEATLRALPPGVGELAQGNLTVPIPGVQQLLENQKNRRDFGGAPIVPRRMENLPSEEQRTENTPLAYSVLSRAFGGSPLKWQNAARGIVSQAEPFVAAATDPIAKTILGKDAPVRAHRPLSTNPLNPASAFIANDPPYSTESERDYYALKDRIAKAKGALRLAVKTNDPSILRRAVSRGDAQFMLHDESTDLIATADQALKVLADRRAELQSMAKGGADVSDELARTRRAEQRIYRYVMQQTRTPEPSGQVATR